VRVARGEAPVAGDPGAPGDGGRRVQTGAEAEREEASAQARSQGARYGRYVGLLALLIVALITVNTLVTKPKGVAGVVPGSPLPPFAAPLATGYLPGDADVATHAHQGAAGRIPACELRGPQILNICALYERAPVVLALFINGGSCAHVLAKVQTLVPVFPAVRFAAVAIGGDRKALRSLVRRMGLTFPVGVDADAAVASLYNVATCPQISFALPGGRVQSRALLGEPSTAALRGRVEQLVAASRARGWQGAG
jgi:hypothetical protein